MKVDEKNKLLANVLIDVIWLPEERENPKDLLTPVVVVGQ